VKKILRFKDFIKEEADYRNVTGNGSMGNPDPQNSGPSFNKGLDSDTYGRPSVIGVQRDTIEDPYFNEREQKRKRRKKHPHIEKNREQKSKYLKNLDVKTNKSRIKHVSENKFISETSSFAHDNMLDRRVKAYIKSDTINVKDLIKEHGKEIAVNELNKLFKGKWIAIGHNNISPKSFIIKVVRFILQPNLDIEIKFDFYYKYLEKTINAYRSDYFCMLYKTDEINEVEFKDVLQIFTDNDPYGEDDWAEE